MVEVVPRQVERGKPDTILNEDDSDSDDSYYYEEANMAVYEKMEFEKWVRDVLYKNRVKMKPMHAVKSRIMHGASFCFIQSFTFLMLAVWCEHAFGGSYRMKRAATGLPVTTLTFLKGLFSMFSFGWAIGIRRHWYKRQLLRPRCIIGYAYLRVIEWVISLWLTLALLVDFGSAPYTNNPHMKAGEIAMYFVLLTLVLFSDIYAVTYGRKLRNDWSQYKYRAFKEYRKQQPTPLINNQSMDAHAIDFDFDHPPIYTLPANQPDELVMVRSIATPRLSHVDIEMTEPTNDHWQFDSNRNLAHNNSTDFGASISTEEFEIRWESLPTSGEFQRSIVRNPTDEEIAYHMQSRGFFFVSSDWTDEEQYKRVRIFCQVNGAVFLAQFIFDINNLYMYSTFKSQDDALTASCIANLQLQNLLY